jgi:uncharacterized membrane protein
MTTLFIGSLLLATFLCSLVSGFIFTYAIVVMPGLAKLEDAEFIRAFQVTDGIIQNNQMLFMLCWIGSIVTVLITMGSGFLQLQGFDLVVITTICVVYLMGVQGITIKVHLPLNNSLQQINIGDLDKESLSKERTRFENRWNYFNNIRTAISIGVTTSFLGYLARLVIN